MNPPRKSLSVINPNDKVGQLRDAFAASGKPAPMATDVPLEGLHGEIVEALRTVYDPEIPVNIYDLGLVYAIDIDAANHVVVRMTLTAPACPVADDIVRNVESAVARVDTVSSAKVDLVFEPPWSKDRMTEAALLELGLI